MTLTLVLGGTRSGHSAVQLVAGRVVRVSLDRNGTPSRTH